MSTQAAVKMAVLRTARMPDVPTPNSSLKFLMPMNCAWVAVAPDSVWSVSDVYTAQIIGPRKKTMSRATAGIIGVSRSSPELPGLDPLRLLGGGLVGATAAAGCGCSARSLTRSHSPRGDEAGMTHVCSPNQHW